MCHFRQSSTVSHSFELEFWIPIRQRSLKDCLNIQVLPTFPTGASISHMLQCFAILVLPDQIKTDNGSCFISQAFLGFLGIWKIAHSRGILYNPRGQAIVEHYNQVLKNHLQKQKRESLPPHDQLKTALFTLNILNFSKDPQLSPFQKHWS